MPDPAHSLGSAASLLVDSAATLLVGSAATLVGSAAPLLVDSAASLAVEGHPSPLHRLASLAAEMVSYHQTL